MLKNALLIFGLIVTPLLAAEVAPVDPDADYDRLDGRGASGKRVDVIEWESNLEIHVYPKGSLAGLALKLDTRDKSKTVMVIGYRFNNNPKKQLIRRALVSIPFGESFKAYRASSDPDYDKIVISNNGLSGDLAEYKLDPQPTKLYPDDPVRSVAGKATGAQDENQVDPVSGKRQPAAALDKPSQKAPADNDGNIKPFQW